MKITLKNGVIVEDVTIDEAKMLLASRKLNQEENNFPEPKKIHRRKYGSRNWTSEEEKYLIDNVGKTTYARIAKELGRSDKAVAIRYYRIKTGRKF